MPQMRLQLKAVASHFNLKYQVIHIAIRRAHENENDAVSRQ